jgi:ribosomal protein L40E
MSTGPEVRRVFSSPSFARQISEKCIKFGIAIGGLLIIRAIASALPMLKYADPLWHRPATDVSATGALPPSLAGWGTVLQSVQKAAEATQFQKGLLAATYARGGPEAADALLKGLMALNVAIFPLTVVRVAIDTGILILFLRLGYEIGGVIRDNFGRLPALGQVISLSAVILVVSLAYSVYQGIFYPLLGPENVTYYGWTFLVVGIIPLVGIIVNVSKNMDAITGVIFSSAQAMAGALKCASCGRPIAAAAKFCPYCGTAAEAPVAAVAIERRFCMSCGAENPPGSRFCKGCGQTFSG